MTIQAISNKSQPTFKANIAIEEGVKDFVEALLLNPSSKYYDKSLSKNFNKTIFNEGFNRLQKMFPELTKKYGGTFNLSVGSGFPLMQYEKSDLISKYPNLAITLFKLSLKYEKDNIRFCLPTEFSPIDFLKEINNTKKLAKRIVQNIQDLSQEKLYKM